MNNIFYSFRRCPYAIRARLAIAYSQQTVTLREVSLTNKPEDMLRLSAKGTVPILQLSDNQVLDESLDIMAWALEKHDPQGWLQANLIAMLDLIDENDFEFKKNLDQYKYGSTPQVVTQSREKAQEFLFKLEGRLLLSPYLFGQKISLADIAIYPFIRQFAAVEQNNLAMDPFPRLQKWLAYFNHSALFHSVMEKYPLWLDSGKEITFPSTVVDD